MKYVRAIAYWSLIPAVIVMPLWYALGRTLFNVGGWGTFFTLLIAAVIVFPYHLILLSVALAGKRMFLSLRTTLLLGGYYFAHMLMQISFIDGGDTEESVASVLTQHGVSASISYGLYLFSLGATFALMVALLVLLVLDAKRNKKTAIA